MAEPRARPPNSVDPKVLSRYRRHQATIGPLPVHLVNDHQRRLRQRPMPSNPLSVMGPSPEGEARFATDVRCPNVGCPYRTNIVEFWERHIGRCAKPAPHEAPPSTPDCPRCGTVHLSLAAERAHRAVCTHDTIGQLMRRVAP